MQRRHVLKLGVVGSALGAVGGIAWLVHAPPIRRTPLAPSALQLLTTIASALLEGSLPTDGRDRGLATRALQERLAHTVSGLPLSSQRELGEVLSLMALAPGRWILSGLGTPWSHASQEQFQDALETMRRSRWVQRRQVYHALRDLARAAWYAAPTTWASLGYPGPRAVA